MLDADVLMVLDRLEAAGLVVWLDGGWGVDALVGVQSRPHRDLDLAEDLTATGVVGGRRVRCTSARLQVRHHLGYPMTDTDRHDLRLLAERFGVAVPPTVLGG